MARKLIRGITAVILIAILSAVLGIAQVSATPPEELNFMVEIIYSVPSSSTASGSWESSGVLESSGSIYEDVSFSGWNEDGWFVKNPHTTLLLSDTHGTITLKVQSHEADFEPFGMAEFSGSWVILDGTGAYTGLHGQGTMDLSGMFYWSCPANVYGVTGPCLVETRSYTGQGHFDPKDVLAKENQ